MIIHKCDFCGKDFDQWDIQEGLDFTSLVLAMEANMMK